MKFVVPFIFSAIFVLLIDLYVYKAICLLTKSIGRKKAKTIKILHWSITVILFVLFGIAIFLNTKNIINLNVYNFIYFVVGFLALFYMPRTCFAIFHLIEDLIALLLIIWQRINKKSVIKRPLFISKIGAIIAIAPFFLVIYGVTIGKYDYHVNHETIYFKKLPKEFDGLRIVQISDIHLGSYMFQYEKLTKAIQLINEQKPSLIFLTGDLVNNFEQEAHGWDTIFSKLKAKYGKFAVLGNHDYGDYYHWANTEDKAANLDSLKKTIDKMGFNLLLNRSIQITKLKKHITILGIENWGHPPFPQYGDLDKTLEWSDSSEFKILLSHDPSSWREIILPKSNIDLTFSGHTHGMQIGFHIFGIKWSPIEYRYKEWSGLYNEGEQYLYVNTGLGFIGFPGRIGMPPEITVIKLKSGDPPNIGINSTNTTLPK